MHKPIWSWNWRRIVGLPAMGRASRGAGSSKKVFRLGLESLSPRIMLAADVVTDPMVRSSNVLPEVSVVAGDADSNDSPMEVVDSEKSLPTADVPAVIDPNA